MKKLILFLTLCLSVSLFSQSDLTSSKIYEEIKQLELTYNRIVIEKYLSENEDSTSLVGIYDLDSRLVTKFRKNRPDITLLREEYELTAKALEDMRMKNPKYRKLKKDFAELSIEEKKKVDLQLSEIKRQMYLKNETYKELSNRSRVLQCSVSRNLLTEMLKEYQLNEMVIPTRFIPMKDMMRYESDYKLKEIRSKIDILRRMYTKMLESELIEKYAKEEKPDALE
jgi:hypothetical protein